MCEPPPWMGCYCSVDCFALVFANIALHELHVVGVVVRVENVLSHAPGHA